MQGVVEHKQPQFSGVAHHPPLILNQSACGVATASSGVASSSSNDVGPIGIPDLNLPLEESMGLEFCEPLDMSVNVANRNLSRAMAAQARQNRLHIYRFKNSIGISKPRYSCRWWWWYNNHNNYNIITIIILTKSFIFIHIEFFFLFFLSLFSISVGIIPKEFKVCSVHRT